MARGYRSEDALPKDDRRRRFELLALPHLDAAYNLARWLAGNPTDAEDVVQDAYLRAYRYFDAFQGGNFRVWLLTIVRNAFMTWVKENRSGRMVFVPDTPLAESADSDETAWGSKPRDPEALLMESIDSQTLNRLMEKLPSDYREVLLLREVEDLSYKEIAEVTGTPMGTVMSRLSRARLALRKLWLDHAELENADGV
ncbi:MAG TPA: sigma-70 family RNA polymerase sigma factor [Acetobacteraceae bacterium]|nr:sigma-70 family RNA polymerase sigma factor [Acetobacteraceae bacterium]